MSDITEHIACIINSHLFGAGSNCECGWASAADPNPDACWVFHVSEVLVAELGLDRADMRGLTGWEGFA